MFASARDIPEGASPRNWDVDYGVGGVFTRPGLQSVYAYATTIEITGYSLGSGNLATFTYIGTEPTVNEGFLLSGFTGVLAVLNGQTVYVEAVSMTQFSAFVVNGPFVTLNNLTATGVSTTGLFVGPNVGSITIGPTWNNPQNLFSPTGYASVATGNTEDESTTGMLGLTGVNQGSGPVWDNPQDIWEPGTSVGYSFSRGQTSGQLLASGMSFSLPQGTSVTGVSVSVATNVGFRSAPTSLSVQLATNGDLIGTPVTTTFSSNTTLNLGSSTYQWGTTLSGTTVNGSSFGIVFTTQSTHAPGLNIGSLVVTVYYTASSVSGTLLGENFAYSLSLDTGITGFVTSFSAYSSTNTSAILQLLQGGSPVGTPKTVQLTTSPTIYNLGASTDLWGTAWTAAQVNSSGFGIQVIGSGIGTTFIGDLDITTYVTPALTNFNWIGSYEQNNAALSTLALDADGNIWIENVIANPGVLSISLTGIEPGSFANGATVDDSEFIMFSDLSIGTDRPRQLYNNGNWYPVTQVGPGVPPTLSADTGAISGTLTLTSYSITGATPNGATINLTFVATSTPPAVNSLYVIGGTGTYLDGQVITVISSPPPTTTTLSADIPIGVDIGTTVITGTATPHFTYAITAITEFAAYSAPDGLWFELGVAPNNASGIGNVVTVYYTYGAADPNLTKQLANPNIGTYVYISGAPAGSFNFNGVWQVVSLGVASKSGVLDGAKFFTFIYTTAGQYNSNGFIPGSDYQITALTMTVAPPIPSLAAGTSITITGATPSGYNNTWTISSAPNTGAYTITTTQYNGDGVVTYGWQFASLTNSQVPLAGVPITITGSTNNAGMNGTFVIATVAGSTFTVNIPLQIPAQLTPVVEGSAQAIMFGNQFTFDPGETFVNTNTDVIYGPYTGGGMITVLGTSIVPIGAGTRQAVCFFITETGSWTPVSPPITFTVSTDANLLNITGLPIGPSNVVGRGVAITEAGANGVPGANFYVITQPVVQTVGTVVTTYTSTIINDNVSTTASFSFTDAVLLNSTEIDIQGLNLFNTIELGSCAWCVPYSSRMFYGLQLNKVDNFNNLTFDGGYVNTNALKQPEPDYWNLLPTASEIQLVESPVTLSAVYISNITGVFQPVMGMMFQTAYQDPYNVAIIAANTGYSVRVACDCPSGIQEGTLVIDLTDYSNGAFGTTYGSFTVPFTSMSSLVQVFSGMLLTNSAFAGTSGEVPASLVLRVWVQNMGVGADVLIDRIEVFPTLFPYLKTEVYGSYTDYPEEIDASGTGGIIDTSTENPQPCFGGFVLRDSFYLLKTKSMYVTVDNPNSEPGGWSLKEISNVAGTVGISSYDVGEEWAVTACRAGMYGFDGGKPELLNLEILPLWDAINWNAGNTICLRNDTENRRIYCAIPLPTGTSPEGVATASAVWLPYAPYNPAPITPNVVLMLNYNAIGSFQELLADIGTHATMFGTLANPDMRRKWTIWNIATPYMGAILRGNYIDTPIFFCNGIDSSKIYQLEDNQLSDDGMAIHSDYCTYGFVNAVKASTLPIFGLHTKRYTVLQFNAEGAGNAMVQLIPNDLQARYPYTIPGGINLVSPAMDDWYRPVNAKGQRMFFEFSTNAVGSWFELCKVLLTGMADAHSSLNPTGGGNNGIV